MDEVKLQDILEFFARTYLAISCSTDDVDLIDKETEKLISETIEKIKELK